MGGTAVAHIIDDLKRRPSRNWSIVITLFGDAIVPRGGSVWLGTLLDFFDMIDIGAGAVRTAMSRLATDGWLERAREGRNSFYRLTDRGRETFVVATRQIYSAGGPQWDGGFDAVFLEKNGTNGQEAIRARLEEAGFGAAAQGVFLAPPGLSVPSDIAAGHVVARVGAEGDACRRLAAAAWPVEQAGDAFSRFVAAFSPLDAALARGGTLSDGQAMVARILLIHEYRRLVLRYRPLPAELLPEAWPGEAALALTRRLYHTLLPQAESWLDRHGRSQQGSLPPADPAIRQRFSA
ncbi:MAG: phenylacetic acid degradation operon negative regulatory protein PaaX [Rhizobiaceae bacterium]